MTFRSDGSHGDVVTIHGKQKVVSEYQLAAIAYNLKRSMSIFGLDELKVRLEALILAILDYFPVRYATAPHNMKIGGFN